MMLGLYISFFKEYREAKAINYEAILIPFFILVVTVLVYILLVVLNKLEKRNLINQFKRITRVFFTMIILTVVGYLVFII